MRCRMIKYRDARHDTLVYFFEANMSSGMSRHLGQWQPNDRRPSRRLCDAMLENLTNAERTVVGAVPKKRRVWRTEIGRCARR